MQPLSIFTMFWELGVGTMVTAFIVFLTGMILYIFNKPLEAINKYFLD